MKILVACEESQAVTIELRKLGHEAYSCDVMMHSGEHDEWHIKGDALPLLDGNCSFITCDDIKHEIMDKWDMIIAFPPCTYLSNAGARFLYPKGILNLERLEKGLEAKEFFMKFYNADCDKIVIENPTPSTVFGLPKYSQSIQPYFFGHPFKKRTNLWIKGVELLNPTDVIDIKLCDSTKTAGNWFNKGGKERQKNRAKTFKGIAEAMANQWTI